MNKLIVVRLQKSEEGNDMMGNRVHAQGMGDGGKSLRVYTLIVPADTIKQTGR